MAAADEVEIANQALHKLGKRRITSFADDTKEARVVNDTYDKSYRAVLEDHKWDFAMQRQVLAVDAGNPPLFGYSSTFNIPTNSARVWDVVRNDTNAQYGWGYVEITPIDFTIEGRRIYTRTAWSEVGCIFIRNDVPTTDFSAAFVDALATRLAFEWCETLAAGTTMKETFFGEYQRKLADAKGTDSQQGRPDPVTPFEWLTGRLG